MLYRLTSETISGAASQNGVITYAYDPVGNRQSMSSTVPAIPAGTFFYDANDRRGTDIYDAEGNTVTSGSLNYVYDFENHLVQQGGASFVYDGDGNRVQKIVAGNVTHYFVDSVNPSGYPQVLAEETASNFAFTNYTWGLDLISRVDFSSGQPIYFVHDGHGSVRALTNSSGAVTDTYDYDAFGNLLHSTGTTPNNYLFADEQFDPNLNLYYNRARYLSTNTGRFWSMDVFEGDPQSPLSLHKYLYSEGDPVNQVDPSGHQIAVVIAVAVAIVAAVALLGYIHYQPRLPRLGLYWKNSFTWRNYLNLKKQDPAAQPDVSAIKQNAFEALKQAYSRFGVTVVEGQAGSGGHTVEVTDTLANGCGQTNYSPSNYSFVSYQCVLNRAEFALRSADPQIMSPAVGRGVGNIAAHEIGHQLGLTVVNQDLDLPGTYDSGNDSDPTIYDGTPQVWTATSQDELPEKLKPF